MSMKLHLTYSIAIHLTSNKGYFKRINKLQYMLFIQQKGDPI